MPSGAPSAHAGSLLTNSQVAVLSAFATAAANMQPQRRASGESPAADAPTPMRLDSSLLPLFRGGPNQSYGYAVVSMDAMRQTAWGSPAGCSLIDLAGQRSAVAQGLKGPSGLAPVTKSSQLRERSTERLYVLAAQAADGGGVFVGLLKVGEKNLYHWDAKGVMHNLQDMPCVLDFYVAEDWQRKGAGHALFSAMLAAERASPERLAYDRPSPKLVGFLKKHFQLSQHTAQQNNMVIFDAFFESGAAPPQRKSSYDSISARPLTARGSSSNRCAAAAATLACPPPTPHLSSEPPASPARLLRRLSR